MASGSVNAGPDSLPYNIETATYAIDTDKLNVNVEYPQIVNLDDSERQQRINALIMEEAVRVKFLQRLANSQDARHFTLRISYEITWRSDRLLSIRFTGYSYGKGAPYSPDVFESLNIDMVNGKKLLLRDLVTIDESFVEKFRAEGIRTVSPLPGHFSGQQVFIDFAAFKTTDDMIRKFNAADELSPEGRRPGTYSYFTRDSFGISTSVAHAIGDHAEFEIKYADIAEYIIIENDVWIDFFPR